METMIKGGMGLKKFVRTQQIAFGLLEGKNYTEIAKELGLNRSHFYTLVKNPEYKQLIAYWLEKEGHRIRKGGNGP